MTSAVEIGLSLGSNLGDRLARLREARDAVAALPGVKILAPSPVYETEPVGVVTEQENLPFLNAVLIVRSALSSLALSDQLHGIEADLGRIRIAGRPNAPRVIDIDLLYAGSETRQDSILRLPHPRWAERRFVVQPLADVRPDLRLPGESRTVREVLLALPAAPKVVLFLKEW